MFQNRLEYAIEYPIEYFNVIFYRIFSSDVVKKSVISTTPITQSEISSSTNLIECAMLESGIQDVPYDSFIQSTSEIQSLLLDQSGSQLLDSEYDSCIQLEERGVNHKDDFKQLEPRNNLSQLWTHLASNEVMEIIDGNMSHLG
jgi:hypothetical protein